ncbi:hypothetical protein, partial [Serratia marcescens]|uniref:hypothetical protein n=3 Tax=Serratia marcescens TaxID=615 RepID=UPI001F14BA3C
CLKTQPATGETYPKSDLFNKAKNNYKNNVDNRYKTKYFIMVNNISSYSNIIIMDWHNHDVI